MSHGTLYDKVWQKHTVGILPSGQTQLLIGLHLIHEVTSPQAFSMLRQRGLTVAFPERTVATVDHIIPTDVRQRPFQDDLAEAMIQALEANCQEFGIRFYSAGSGRQGIVHVIAPEQGLTQPGMTIACGDSHTSTHGAFGAIAFGIGTSQVRDVLASQTLALNKLKVRKIELNGSLAPGVYAKDVILHLICTLGVKGGVGYAYEFAGTTFAQMNMEERMTVCNMAIEAGARAGLVAPDEKTFAYLQGRQYAPQGADWDKAVAYWQTLVSDQGAKFDTVIEMDAAQIEPQVTWGTSPEQVLPVGARVPNPANEKDPVRRGSIERALQYMGLKADTPIDQIKIDKVFIGSCTNSRIEDLRAAAAVAQGRQKAKNVKLALVVPGSGQVKRQAEAEGLDKIFTAAGFEWREPGCSMCLAMNADRLEAGERCASTSNRNFEGRQGAGGRTHLVSPEMAAAAAIAGHFVDIRSFWG